MENVEWKPEKEGVNQLKRSAAKTAALLRVTWPLCGIIIDNPMLPLYTFQGLSPCHFRASSTAAGRSKANICAYKPKTQAGVKCQPSLSNAYRHPNENCFLHYCWVKWHASCFPSKEG